MFALELRGHGGTSMPPASRCAAAPWQCFGVRDLADDCVAFMKAKGISSTVLVGHSLGSLVAQELALDHPSMVTKLVLVGTAGETVDNAGLKDWLWIKVVSGEWRKRLNEKGYKWPADAYDLPLSSVEPNVRGWLLKSWDPDTVVNPELLSTIVSEAAQIRLGTWIGVTAALLHVDNRERLKHLKVPVLVVWGVQDVWFYGSVQTDLIETFNQAVQVGQTSFYWKQYGIIPLPRPETKQEDIGHFVQWDAPEGLATDIGSFVAKGKPTDDLYRSGWPHDVRQIVQEGGKGIVIHEP
jgi:pimeloyl-ACP methyl ester carboxylesterase